MKNCVKNALLPFNNANAFNSFSLFGKYLITIIKSIFIKVGAIFDYKLKNLSSILHVCIVFHYVCSRLSTLVHASIIYMYYKNCFRTDNHYQHCNWSLNLRCFKVAVFFLLLSPHSRPSLEMFKNSLIIFKV